MEPKTKNIIIISAFSAIVLLLILAIIFIIIDSNTIKGNMDNAINAVVSKDNTIIKIGNKEIELSKGERVKILQEDVLNGIYVVKYEDKIGKIESKNVLYYDINKFDKNSKYSIMTDVSSFNIMDKNSEDTTDRNFKDEKDFEIFLLENDIQYVYIRLGGRGWGQKGVLYYDDEAPIYIEACEYLGIPYGFYYLDEALNDEEIKEEVQFVKEFVDKYKTNMNKLPLAIDLEYQSGKGRTDNIWEERTILLNKLIYEFKRNNIECIVYSNGARIEKYIKGVNANFWVAMYPQEDIIPENNYKATVKMEQLENQLTTLVSNNLNTKINKGGTEVTTYSDEFLDKVIAWQFSESGAENDGIEDYIDLSIVNSNIFKNYIK